MSLYGYGENKFNYSKIRICNCNFFENLYICQGLVESELECDAMGN